MEFDIHVESKVLKSWQQICYKGFLAVGLFIIEKVFRHHQKWKPYSPFLIIHLSDLITDKCVNLWSIKHTSLDLFEWQSRENRDYVLETFTVSI